MFLCLFVPSFASAGIGPYCGDGIINFSLGELCDNGLANHPVGSMDPVWGPFEGDGDRTYCSTDCEPFFVPGIWCGDLTTNGPEACDGETNCNGDCSYLDDEGPLFYNIHVDPEYPTCSEDSYIFVNITDVSGIPGIPPNLPVTLHWKYNGYPWTTKPFTISPTGD